MNILDQIIEHKREEVERWKASVPMKALEQAHLFSRPTVSLKESIRDKRKSGIIAEFKRRSPSKGVINGDALPDRVTRSYVEAGASALSVLTDQKFFGGSNDDLSIARKVNACPILRKDFTIDEYQIVEARAIGADAILLIAAVLSAEQSKRFITLAHGYRRRPDRSEQPESERLYRQHRHFKKIIGFDTKRRSQSLGKWHFQSRSYRRSDGIRLRGFSDWRKLYETV